MGGAARSRACPRSRPRYPSSFPATRWLMGIARAAVVLNRRAVSARSTHPTTLPVQPPPGEAEQALRQEDDHENEDDADRDQVELGEEARERLAQQKEKG